MARAQPETVVVRAIRRALVARGCEVVKMHGSQYMPEGFPDLLVIRPDGVVAFVEVKVPGRTDGPAGNGLSRMQLWWLLKLAVAGHRCGSADCAADAELVAWGR